MFLHLLAADPKWIPMALALHEQATPGEQVWAVLDAGGISLPEGVRSLEGAHRLDSLLAERRDWEGLILHGLLPRAQPAIARIPDDLPVAWVTWGWEAHQTWPALRRRIHSPRTREALARIDGEAPAWKRLLRPLVRSVRERRLAHATREVARRLDVCVVQFEEEHELFRRTGLLDEDTEFCWGAVGGLEQFGGGKLRLPTGSDIQLGNSAYWANNHLDAIETLRQFDLGARRVVTPLTYGDERCRETVIRAGREAFGERFVPLVDHLPLERYEDLMQSCGVAWMHHGRQQGVGTILGAVWRGATVYMQETAAFAAFVREGLALRSLEQLRPETLRLEPAPTEEADANRRILERLLCRERVLGAVEELHETLRRRGADRRSGICA